jgi:hypothetical protein
MTAASPLSSRMRILIAVLALGALAVGAWWFVQDQDMFPRGEALEVALRPLIEGPNADRSLVARAILDNYHETRANAARWSGVYWGCTFVAAVLSALAALVLKLETLIRNEGAKKDLAALFSVAAALLITISTSGDFQRKWQANRIAAAELEQTGYELLEQSGADARSYLAPVGKILLRRHMAIVGGTEPGRSFPEAASAAARGK